MGFFSDFKDDLESSLEEVNETQDTAAAEELPIEDISLENTAIEGIEPEEALTEEALTEEISLEEIPVEEVAAVDGDVIGDIPSEPLQDEQPVGTEEADISQLEAEISAEAENITENQIEEESIEMSGDKNEFENVLSDGPATDEVGSITAGMTINGNISSEGSLDVFGTVVGDITVKGKLNISGSITGNSNAAEIFADSAKITGEVISNGAVKVGQESVIIGNIAATSAVIAGAVKGNIDVHGPVILDTSAIVMGDIKSKSVQINNGAVIEGHCSQAYADVSPTSFFDDLKSSFDDKKKK